MKISNFLWKNWTLMQKFPKLHHNPSKSKKTEHFASFSAILLHYKIGTCSVSQKGPNQIFSYQQFFIPQHTFSPRESMAIMFFDLTYFDKMTRRDIDVVRITRILSHPLIDYYSFLYYIILRWLITLCFWNLESLPT